MVLSVEEKKAAQKVRSKRSYELHKQERKENAKIYRKINSERINLVTRQYREKNRTKYKLATKSWRERNRERYNKKAAESRLRNKEKINLRGRQWRREVKYVCLRMYSDYLPLCVCCAEHHVEFLTIDHPNKDGAAHRKSIGVKSGSKFYLWLRRNNFPSGFRVLCFNCNSSDGSFGVCPHLFK